MELPSKVPESTNSLGMEFKLIHAATFTMGDRTGSEQWTRHNVTLTQSCQMGVHEVSQAQHEHIRSENGPEFVSKVICHWLKQADVKTLFIAKGSPWESGYVESFNGTLRDELLNREILLSFEEACWVIDRCRLDYNHHCIHSSLDYQTPVAYAKGCVLPASAASQPPEHSHITNPSPLTQPGAKTGW